MIFQTAKLKGGDQPTYHSAGLWYLCVVGCVCVCVQGIRCGRENARTTMDIGGGVRVFKGLSRCVVDRVPEELWIRFVTLAV